MKTKLIVKVMSSEYQVWEVEGWVPENAVCAAPDDESLYTKTNARGDLCLDQAKLSAIVNKVNA